MVDLVRDLEKYSINPQGILKINKAYSEWSKTRIFI